MASIKNKDLFLMGILALIYYCLAILGMALFALKPSNITLLWLPSGIAMVMCLRWGYRSLPFIILASFSANFSGMSASSELDSLLHTVIAAMLDGMVGVLTMHLFKHFLPNGLTRINDLVPFGLLVCLLPTTITSMILFVNLAGGGYVPWNEAGDFIRMLILADSLGILLIYPMYQGWCDNRTMGKTEMYWTGGSTLVIVILLILGFTVLPGMIFFILPLLLVLAFNVQLNGVATISSLTMIAIIAATAHNIGPFVATDPMESNFRLMAFVFANAFTILGITLQSRQVVSADLLRKSEESLKESQMIAGLGSYVMDIPSGLWQSSDLLDGLFGISENYEKSIEGWAALVHPDDRLILANYLKNEVIAQGKDFDKEYRIIRLNDQANRWLHGLGKLECDAQGQPFKLHGTIQDITTRKEAEFELRKAKENTEHALTEQSRFMSMLTHELKTPLSVLRMALGIMNAKDSLKNHVDRALEDMNIIIERASQVDLLEQHQFDVRPELCHIDDVLLSMKSSSWAPSRIFIATEPLPIVNCDLQLLRIILGNLISNAIKYSAPETDIEISAVSSEKLGKLGVLISIQNQAGSSGLPDPERLFDKYYRSPGAYGKTGSGLGLYLVRSITELLGGQVVYDVVQEKVRFTLWIPC